MFDTLEYLNDLKESGMRQEEAEAITRATSKAFSQLIEIKQLTTKHDLKELEIGVKKEIKELEIATTKEIRALELSTKKDIRELEISNKKETYEMKTELTKLISNSMWKTITILGGLQTVMIGTFELIKHVSL